MAAAKPAVSPTTPPPSATTASVRVVPDWFKKLSRCSTERRSLRRSPPFNKKWDTWGAFDYEKNKGEDALQVKVKPTKGAPAEKLTYTIDKSGKVTLMWGDRNVSFNVS